MKAVEEDRANKLRPNGAGAAAVLAAGIGCFAVGLLAVLGDASTVLRTGLSFYGPTGPLSGVTTVAILVWIASWTLLDWRWRRRDVALGRVKTVAFVLLGLGLLLTFPPFGDLF